MYTADSTRGVDVLRFEPGAGSARASGREVVVPRPSGRHLRFLSRIAAQYKADPATAGLCFLRVA